MTTAAAIDRLVHHAVIGIRVSFGVRLDSIGEDTTLIPVRIAIRPRFNTDRLVADLLFLVSKTGTSLGLRATDEEGNQDVASVDGPALATGKWTHLSLEVAPSTEGDRWWATTSFDGGTPHKVVLPSQIRSFDTAALVLGDNGSSPFVAALDDLVLVSD